MKEKEYRVETEVTSYNTYKVFAISEEDAYQTFVDGDYELISSRSRYEKFLSAKKVEEEE